MSSTYSAASAVSASGLKEPECEPSRSARSNRSAVPYSPSTGQKFPATTTCEALPLIVSPQTALPLISSAEASPARTSASPASEPEQWVSWQVRGDVSAMRELLNRGKGAKK